MEVDCVANASLSEAHGDFIGIIGKLLEDLAEEPRESQSAIAELKKRASDFMKNSHMLLQTVFRATCLRILKNISSDCDPGKVRYRISLVLRLVDYSNELIKNREVDMVLPSALLEYVFSLCTLRQMAASLPAIRERLISASATAAASSYTPTLKERCKLDLLKSALVCIRRDSAAIFPRFSGRLHVMLSSALPLWSPSGLNKRGLRNVDNVTEYSNEENFTAELKCNLVQPDLSAKTKDFPLYQTFWSLQKILRNPFDNGELSETWPRTKKSLTTVLSSLEQTVLVPGPSVEALIARFPKYLSDPCVLHLQLADAQWRRHVLTQFTMFFLYIKTVSEDLGEFRNNPEKLIWEKNRPFCKKLFALDGEGHALCVRIFKLLDKDDPNGKYAKYAAEILDNEAHWIRWKLLRSCPKLDKRAYQPAQRFTRKRRKLSTAERLDIDGDDCLLEKPMSGMPPAWIARQDAFKVVPSSSVMSLLEKRLLPEIETSVEVRNLLEADRFEADEEMKLTNDPKFSWQALRAMCLTDMKGMAKVMCETSEFCVDLEKLLSNSEDLNSEAQKKDISEETMDIASVKNEANLVTT